MTEGAPLNKNEQQADQFQQGAAWVGAVLVPAVKQANEEMQGSGAAFRLDLTRDHQIEKVKEAVAKSRKQISRLRLKCR